MGNRSSMLGSEASETFPGLPATWALERKTVEQPRGFPQAAHPSCKVLMVTVAGRNPWGPPLDPSCFSCPQLLGLPSCSTSYPHLPPPRDIITHLSEEQQGLRDPLTAPQHGKNRPRTPQKGRWQCELQLGRPLTVRPQ